MMPMRICVICGKEFVPKSNRQKYCPECRIEICKEKGKQDMKRYYLKYPEQQQKWALKHPEQAKECLRKNQRKYNLMHSEQIKQYGKQWRKDNPEKYRKIYLKYNNKRNRNLGFILLSDWQEGYVAHHLDKNYVIYMPEGEHKSVPHSVLRNLNMDIINAIAFNYLP
jgi:hypothetical protein